jgi:hypothetical protein
MSCLCLMSTTILWWDDDPEHPNPNSNFSRNPNRNPNQSCSWLQLLKEHKPGMTLPLPVHRILSYVKTGIAMSFDISYRH